MARDMFWPPADAPKRPPANLAEAIETKLRALAGCWVEHRCGCATSFYPVRLMLSERLIRAGMPLRRAERLVADNGYGSAELLGWLVREQGIEPHVPVFDQSARMDGTFSRDDLRHDHEKDIYTCPGGKRLRTYRRRFATLRSGVTKDNTVLTCSATV